MKAEIKPLIKEEEFLKHLEEEKQASQQLNGKIYAAGLILAFFSVLGAIIYLIFAF